MIKNLAFVVFFTLVIVSVVNGQKFRAILYNSPGPDSDTYFEITGTPNMALTGITFLEIEGDGTSLGIIDDVIDLSSYSLGSNGLLLYRQNASMLPTPDPETTVITNTSFNPENGDITFLLVKDFTGALGDDLDTNNDGVLEVTPWSQIVDGVGGDQDNADPDIATSLGFPTINDVGPNNTGACISEPMLLFNMTYTGCGSNGIWQGAVVENSTDPDHDMKVKGNTWVYNQTCTDCTSHANALLTPGIAIGALPIDIILFSGESRSNYNQLYWKVENAVDFSHFEIEKFVDGDWVYISRMEESPNSKTYSFTDFNLGNSQAHLYRLKLVDLNQSFTYSNIVSLNGHSNSAQFSIFPNPVIDHLTIKSKNHERFKFILLDVYGNAIKQGQGQDTHQIDCSILTPGMYQLHIISEDKEVFHKIVVGH